MSILGRAADLDSHHIEGFAIHGDTPFSCPLVSHIHGNLWTGGCEHGVRLPDDFRYVVSLHPLERYALGPDTERIELWLDDAPYDLGAGEAVYETARWALGAVRRGKTLIHCQAGLNRSSLIAALVLVLDGMTPDSAIDLLRERRSEAVLCNPSFEDWLRRQDPQQLVR